MKVHPAITIVILAIITGAKASLTIVGHGGAARITFSIKQVVDFTITIIIFPWIR